MKGHATSYDPNGEGKTVIRWVLTFDDGPDWRELAMAQQGRNTYETRTEAEQAMALWAVGPDGLSRIFNPSTMATLKVSPWECWVGHHDPVSTCAPMKTIEAWARHIGDRDPK